MSEWRAGVREKFERATGRFVCWADDGLTTFGDFEGRETTLEIFDVPFPEQRALFKSLRLLRAWAEMRSGGSLIIIFHTPAATQKHYPWARTDDVRPMVDVSILLGSVEPVRRVAPLWSRHVERFGTAGGS